MSVRACVCVGVIMMMMLFLTEMCVTTWISPLQDKKKSTLPYSSLDKNNRFKFNIKYLWCISNQTQSILTFNFKNCYDGIEFSDKQLPYSVSWWHLSPPQRVCVVWSGFGPTMNLYYYYLFLTLGKGQTNRFMFTLDDTLSLISEM